MSSPDGVSLKGARRRLQGSYFNISEVIDDYRIWLEQIFYVLVYRFNYNEGKYEYGAFRSPKRGDKLYARRVLRKFDSLRNELDATAFFRLKDHLNIVRGRVLHLVLEYDANLFQIVDSWAVCGLDLNRYMSYLRRHFGRCSIIRCYEAHESGLCHIHIIVYFYEKVFQGRLHYNKKKRSYRVFGEDWRGIKAGWKHGYSNVEMVDSVQGGAYYLRKYLVKSVDVEKAGSKGIKGLAMCWFMRKRSFSISGEFRQLYRDVINTNSNSTNEIVSVMVGWDLFGEKQFLKVTKWKLLGFLLSDHVIWEVNFTMLKSTQIVCIDEGRQLFELVKDDVVVDDECQKHF